MIIREVCLGLHELVSIPLVSLTQTNIIKNLQTRQNYNGTLACL